jgi:hypothetical protein
VNAQNPVSFMPKGLFGFFDSAPSTNTPFWREAWLSRVTDEGGVHELGGGGAAQGERR